MTIEVTGHLQSVTAEPFCRIEEREWSEPLPPCRYSGNLTFKHNLHHAVINNGLPILVGIHERMGTLPVNQPWDAKEKGVDCLHGIFVQDMVNVLVICR